jgi:hypothetical protein
MDRISFFAPVEELLSLFVGVFFFSVALAFPFPFVVELDLEEEEEEFFRGLKKSEVLAVFRFL